MNKLIGLIAIIIISAGAAFAQNVNRASSALERSEKRIEKRRPRAAQVVVVGPSTTFLKEGLTIEEALKLLGQPVSISERQERGKQLATYTFTRSPGRVLLVEFENSLLVRSSVEILERIVQNRKSS